MLLKRFFCHLVEKECCFLFFLFLKKRGNFKVMYFLCDPLSEMGSFTLLLLTSKLPNRPKPEIVFVCMELRTETRYGIGQELEFKERLR